MIRSFGSIRESIQWGFRPITAALLIWLGAGSIWALAGETKFDGWGNPVGEQYGLAAKGDFKGKRLLVWSGEPEVIRSVFPENNPLWQALRRRGFVVDIRLPPFDARWLGEADELWLFSGRNPHMNEEGYKAVISFIRKGKGVYIIADNDRLRQLTGQNFGPSEGDGIAGAADARKKWQAWWKANGEK